MQMVDGVCLVVCASEGPMAQTKFVLKKALSCGLKPMVIINKIDRPTARVAEVENEVFELFCELDAHDDTLDYQLFKCSAKNNFVEKDGKRLPIESILDGIIEHMPPPKVKDGNDFEMLISQQEHHPYFGKIVIGKIFQGEVKLNDQLTIVDQTGKLVQVGKVFKILRRYGMNQLEMAKAVAGDIVQLAGFSDAIVTHTCNSYGKSSVIPSIPIDPPMMQISI